MNLRLSTFISFCFVLASCGFGTRYDLSEMVPPLGLDSSDEIAVVVRDRRPDVIAGLRPPQWLGRQMRGPGQAEEILTASGDSLARDMARAIVKALTASGARAIAPEATESPFDSPSAETGRILRITVRALQVESFVNVSLQYDLQAEVVDREGATIGRGRARGDDLIGGDIVYPLGHGGELVPKALGRILADLLASSGIRVALK